MKSDRNYKYGMECLKKYVTLKKGPKTNLLGQKLHFLGVVKRPKMTVWSEVIPNLKKKKQMNAGMFETNPVSIVLSFKT